jgi:hypothetical protein
MRNALWPIKNHIVCFCGGGTRGEKGKLRSAYAISPSATVLSQHNCHMHLGVPYVVLGVVQNMLMLFPVNCGEPV